jgi:hypothetical protein
VSFVRVGVTTLCNFVLLGVAVLGKAENKALPDGDKPPPRTKYHGHVTAVTVAPHYR